LHTALDRGAARMIEESFALRGAEESKQLRFDLSFLREKLGFRKQHPASVGSAIKSKELSSRQIPVGKKLHITHRKIRSLGEIESTVVKNSDVELVVKLAKPIEATAGEFWRARYYFGASIWEFDASVVSCDGDVLVLNHSDNVRFINRRRFLRVPVNEPAFIARFPFARTFLVNGNAGQETQKSDGFEVGQSSTDASSSAWEPPEFVPAVVTELAGPGLRIEVPLKVKVGDRVLVVFRLDEEKHHASGSQENGNLPTSRIIEDIGEVKHVKVIQKGFSIAVALTGLSDSDVNELIRATNVASVRAGGGKDQGSFVSVSDKQGTEGGIREMAVVEGV